MAGNNPDNGGNAASAVSSGSNCTASTNKTGCALDSGSTLYDSDSLSAVFTKEAIW